MEDTRPSALPAATPQQLGFRMPAEWQPHASTWMAWPHDADQWVGMLDPVRWEFAALVRAVAEADGVDLLVADQESEADARSRLDGAAVRYHLVPHQDLWLRDSGPIFVTRAGEVALTDWEFNGWGGKYPAALDNRIPAAVSRILGVSPFPTGVVFEGGSIEVSGEGTGLTTRQCLLSSTRNPRMGETDIEHVVRDYLGIDRLIWLNEGLEGDHTDGHIDTLTRFADAGTIVTSVCHDRSDANHATLAANLAVLRGARREDGRAFTVVELPVPTGRVEFEGERLPLTYANFYLANGVVIAPIYGAAEDREAIEILRTVFPDRTVVPLEARALITGGGAFHCVTQQQPAGRLWSGA